MKRITGICFIMMCVNGYTQFAPAAGKPESTAIHKDSSRIVNWASIIESFNPGRTDITDIGSPLASFGVPENALGPAKGTSVDIVSLGDAGSITLGFDFPIKNGVGNDFAVFENSFSDTHLEFAHVEVSTDGVLFVRFPSICNIQSLVQTGAYALSDPTLVHNLAGKYRQGYGTPFDLDDLIGKEGINLDSINFVRIIDVVGSINAEYGTVDSEGNIINDPYPSVFESGGFDLDGIAVMNESNPFANTIAYAYDHLFQVYPNPTNGNLYFTNTANIEQLTVFSIRGHLIGEFQPFQAVNLAELNVMSGIYLIKILTRDQQVIIKKIAFELY